MSRYAHLWFIIGIIISAGTAFSIWLLLSAVGSMSPIQASAIVATIEALFLVGLWRWLTSGWRARRRLHERISRELRCRMDFPSQRSSHREHSCHHC